MTYLDKMVEACYLGTKLKNWTIPMEANLVVTIMLRNNLRTKQELLKYSKEQNRALKKNYPEEIYQTLLRSIYKCEVGL